MKSGWVFIILVTATLGGCGGPEVREITARTFPVARVIDGDPFVVEYDGELTSVQIWGINAPELRDPGGPEAQKALAELVAGRTVMISFPGYRKRDNFGRLLCGVHVEGIDVGAVMVQEGFAERKP